MIGIGKLFILFSLSTLASGSSTKSSTSTSSSGSSSGAIQGTATYYTTWSSSPGSCGQIPQNGSIVAINSSYMNGKCGSCIQVNYQGKTIKVTVTDTCAGCDSTHIDLSNLAFQQLAPLSDGNIPVTWSFVPC